MVKKSAVVLITMLTACTGEKQETAGIWINFTVCPPNTELREDYQWARYQAPGSQHNVVTKEGRPCVYTVPAHSIPTAESTL